MGAGSNLSHWIYESADHLQPIKTLILSCYSSAYKVGGLHIMHCMIQSAMLADIYARTEPVYRDDQFAHSYSNPYNTYNISAVERLLLQF